MEFNRKNMQKIALLITFAILMYLGLQKISFVLGALLYTLHLAMPFVVGGAIAFIINVPMKWIEGRLFSRRPSNKWLRMLYRMRRPVSLVLTFLLVLGVVGVLCFMVIPEMIRSLMTVGTRLTTFFDRLVAYVNTLASTYPDLVNQVLELTADWRSIDWKQAGKTVVDFLLNGNILGNTFSVASSIIGGVANFFIGLVFAVYVLLQKEKLGRQFKKILYSFLSESKADGFLEICSLTCKTFSNFISGQCLEACILGMMFFICMTLLRLPYAVVISMLIAVTALIPIFGAFIGCIVGAFLILIVNPVQALWFLILFLVLQQVEGNLIYPHVVGNSVGLPSIWVLMAVTLGASTMGVIGMIINIPIFSIVYTLLRRTVYDRLRRRAIPREKFK